MRNKSEEKITTTTRTAYRMNAPGLALSHVGERSD